MGPHKGCAQQLFTVEQWFATDAPPYKLEESATTAATPAPAQPRRDAAGPAPNSLPSATESASRLLVDFSELIDTIIKGLTILLSI